MKSKLMSISNQALPQESTGWIWTGWNWMMTIMNWIGNAWNLWHVLLKGFDASAMDSSNKNMPFRKMDDVKIQHSSH